MKLYLARLSRTESDINKVYGGRSLPQKVYKIGITGLATARDRLTYKGSDEPFPILRYFPNIEVLEQIEVGSEDRARVLERATMTTISGGPSKRFHNWYEPHQISGITEMRRWDLKEVELCIKMFDMIKGGSV